MTFALFPTVLWAVAMVAGAFVAVRVLIRMQRRRRVQRRYRADDAVLAEVADRNVAFAWLLTSTLFAFAVAGFVSIAGQVVAGPDEPLPHTFRWVVVALLVVGGMALSGLAIWEDRHAVKAHQLAMDAEAEQAMGG